MKPLTPYEKWMVKSNLETIRRGVTVAKQVTILRANGYSRIADAVEAAITHEIKGVERGEK